MTSDKRAKYEENRSGCGSPRSTETQEQIRREEESKKICARCVISEQMSPGAIFIVAVAARQMSARSNDNRTVQYR